MSLCENCMTGARCCGWCIPRLYLLMSRGVKWAFRSDVTTQQMILTFWTVTAGSESSNSSLGRRPMLCRTAAFLLSLQRIQREREKHHSLFPETENLIRQCSRAHVQSCSSLQPLWLILLNIPSTIFGRTFPCYWWQAAADVDRAADRVCRQSWTRASLLRNQTSWPCDRKMN